MSPTKIGVLAGLALAARAVLIPSTMAADFGDDNALETYAIDPFRRSVALECPGCAFATQEDEGISWKKNVGNALLLDFNTGRQEDSLDIAGFQLYPPSLNAAIGEFYVTQIDPHAASNLRLRVTGFQSRFNGAETISEAGMELLPLTLQITSLEGVPVSPPELKINLLKDANGRLMIASFETTHPTEDTPALEDEECNEWPLLCKWKGIVAERIEKMKKMGKGCHKKPHGHHNPMEDDDLHGKPPHRFRPGRPHPHHRPHHIGHHGKGHHGHRVHMFLRRAILTILIPIVVGIFAGTVTYLIGMAVGCVIAIIIAKVRGQQYQPVALEEDVEQPQIESKERNEKEEYAELPAYDAPPVYEDAKEVAESK